MGSSLGCFGNDNGGNNTICFSLVGITGVSVVLLVAAVIVLCCVCWRKKRLRGRGRLAIYSELGVHHSNSN